MLRILLAASALVLLGQAAHACEGQTGNVIFEDKFTDDSGGWGFGDNLVLKEQGAEATIAPGDAGRTFLQGTFNARLADYCLEVSFSPDAAAQNVSSDLVFLANNYDTLWDFAIYADGRANLSRKINGKWNTVFETKTQGTVKSGPTDVNSVRVVVKEGMITTIVNGKTVKALRAQVPSGDMLFGFATFRDKASNKASPPMSIHSYEVTEVQ